MADRTITSGDLTLVIACDDLLIAATQIQGFATDAAFATEAVDIAETQLGVDGRMSVGWIPRTFPQTITLAADSPSRPVFDLIVGLQDARRNVYRLQGILTLPGNQYSYTMSRGVLKNYSVIPNGQKTLQPMPFVIEWEKIAAVPIG